jgi:pimeloyl-ACP methyl ester carboxylesterase
VLLRRLTVSAGVLALVLAGCAAPKEQVTPQESGSSASTGGPSADGDVDALYAQDVSWEDCGTYECTTVLAPLDWDDPSAGTIYLALQRSLARDPGKRLGSLLINPGGPGASGIDFLDYMVTGILGDDMLDAYDVVGFDPRGVGASTAVDCGPGSVVDPYLTADVTLASQADLDAARARAQAFGQGCADATGPLLGHVDTVSAARDMDLLRAVLGDEKLTYAGFSYGTFLGATYADLYPQNVGRMLLDGALDPSMSNDDLSLQQAAGFEQALRAYVEDCQAGRGCPLTGSVDDGMAQIKELVDRAEERPLDTGFSRQVNGALAFYGVIVTLYDDSYWPLLTQALTEAITENKASMLLEFANLYLERTADGEYQSNSMVAFSAVNCLDYPAQTRDWEQMQAFAAQVSKQAPTFGDWFAMGVGCEVWPYQSVREPAPVTAAGAAPILVVGTTGDPATPYEWSVALADQLESGTLLTWEGEGHTAYGRAGECVSDAVETYFLTGKVPADGTVC